MTQTTMSIRLNSSLSDFVAHNVGTNGTYDNVSEYVRDLIRQDKNRAEDQKFMRLKTELQQAFAEPTTNYASISAEDIIHRNQERR